MERWRARVASSAYYFSTAGLIPGTHTLTIEYSGDPVYTPSSYSQTFTVAPPAPGTPFVCETGQTSYPMLNASVVAVAMVPSPVPSGLTVPVSALDLTLNTDPAAGPGTFAPVKNRHHRALSRWGHDHGTCSDPNENANGITSVSSTDFCNGAHVWHPSSVVAVGVSSLHFHRKQRLVRLCNQTDPTAPAVVQRWRLWDDADDESGLVEASVGYSR